MADIKNAYGSSVDLTITLASLATDSSLLTGRASTAIDETSNKYIDELLAGFVSTGTSPTTAKEIHVYVYGCINDTPTYPDSITGSDAAKTMTTANIRDAGLRLAAMLSTTATSNEKTFFGPISVRYLFGGTLPKKWGVFITHNTGVNLNSTSGNHKISATPVYQTVV